jgi:formate dehydrogenase subunit gamma
VELFRVSRDIYGREVLQGMSWDLLWVFVGVGCVLIVGHALYRLTLAPKQR